MRIDAAESPEPYVCLRMLERAPRDTEEMASLAPTYDERALLQAGLHCASRMRSASKGGKGMKTYVATVAMIFFLPSCGNLRAAVPEYQRAGELVRLEQGWNQA